MVKGIEQDFNTMKISPPCAMDDSFWHSHILETEAYHCTCEYLFGQYVHHKMQNQWDMPEKIKTYWAAHAKHFPGDDGDGDKDDVLAVDDLDSSESYEGGFCCA